MLNYCVTNVLILDHFELFPYFFISQHEFIVKFSDNTLNQMNPVHFCFIGNSVFVLLYKAGMVSTPLTTFYHSLITIKNSAYSYPLLYLHKQTGKHISKNFSLDDFLALCFTTPLCSTFAFLGRFQTSHTVSGSLFGAPPCNPEHLPGPVHHGLSDAGRDINNKS